MPIRIADQNGELHYAAPKIYNGYWRNAVAWVYSGGAWRRTYDPKDENLLINSRLLNGTDYFTYADGRVIGFTPPGWSAYSNAPQVGGNAYAYYSNREDEYSRSYTFKAASSRMFFQTRIYVRQGETYNASAFVHSINLQVGRKSFDIFVDGVPANKQSDYIQMLTQFPTVPDLKANTRVQCVFRALKDCLVQFNIGVGVDYNDSGEIRISQPMISKSSTLLSYQPTPKDTNYNAIILKGTYMKLNKQLPPSAGTNHIESSVQLLDNVSDKIMIVGHNNDISTSGIGVDIKKNTLFVMAENVITHEAAISYKIPLNQVFGAGIWYDVSGGYVKNIRLHANGELIARINETTSVVAATNFVFGSLQYPVDGLIVEQFGLFVNGKNHIFNVEEGDGNISSEVPSTEQLSVSFGSDDTKYEWLGALLPKVTVNPNEEYIATSGMKVELVSSGSNYDTIEWRTQYGSIANSNSNNIEITVADDYDYGLLYHAVYRNRFGSVSTTTTKISAFPTPKRLMSDENGNQMGTEDDKLIENQNP
ncbi:hypothetical protein phiAS5_ORF0002 [Aeromonas phage phiAS5]|uniref:Uncharacterized protein n=1 Tax=Aeromonas phage phiAS5 TaxID=879630 RepID=E1A299_9CAUD|nr:hypothetical protein phiAS5_ORF0002 [Aeromonas phage phiAS5]ADM79845.1 hypothetical protein phiAS5_ORF0002 [Aeromonas phage phiAS5]BES53049.1 hypothetical protein [Aeromonas phage phiWae14]